MKLIQFTRTSPENTPIAINPEAVACITILNGKTAIHLNGSNSDGNGLRFTVAEDYEFVCKCLTTPEKNSE